MYRLSAPTVQATSRKTHYVFKKFILITWCCVFYKIQLQRSSLLTGRHHYNQKEIQILISKASMLIHLLLIQGRVPEAGSPDFPVPSLFIQLFQMDSETFSGQQRDIVSSIVSCDISFLPYTSKDWWSQRAKHLWDSTMQTGKQVHNSQWNLINSTILNKSACQLTLSLFSWYINLLKA